MPIFLRDPEWEPFRELENLQRRMDRLFRQSYGVERLPWRVGVSPLVNISEDHDYIYVRAELPGVKAQDLEIHLKDKNLVIIGISDEKAAKVEPFVKDMAGKMDYAVALDKERETFRAYMVAFGVKGIPHAFVVDTKGNLVWHGHPMTGLDKVVEQVLDRAQDADEEDPHRRAGELHRLRPARMAGRGPARAAAGPAP